MGEANEESSSTLYNSNTQPLNRPGLQPSRPKTPINRTLAEHDRHVPVRKGPRMVGRRPVTTHRKVTERC
eukprot:351983-Chlamydomonas_euryale.AAC.1